MHWGARVSYADNIPNAIERQNKFPTKLNREKAACSNTPIFYPT